MEPLSFVGLSPDTLVIPTVSLVDPFGILDWLDPTTHTIITVPILGKLVWCESACCCYKLQRNYQNGELLALWAETPCINDDTPCPPGCTGCCADMAFVWIKGVGFIEVGKISLNFNNPIPSKSSIMPNPNDGTFDIKLSNAETGILRIVVFDVQGNELFSANANKNSDEILTSIKLDLSSGSYFIYLSMDDRFIGLEKFIVNK